MLSEYFRSTLCLLIAISIAPALVRAQTGSSQAIRTSAFTPNHGQVVDLDGKSRPDILFTAEDNGVTMYMHSTSMSYVFQQIEGDVKAWLRSDCMPLDSLKEPVVKLYRMDVEFVGANPAVEIESYHPTGGCRNFYLAHCPDGITNVGQYRTVVYRNLYPHIDMVSRFASDGTKKVDFVVHPGGNPADIRMKPVGASSIRMLPSRGVKIETPLGYLQEEAPYSYTEVDESTDILSIRGTQRDRAVESGWVIREGVMSFEVADYDRTKDLVIDPVRCWATFVGGTESETNVGSGSCSIDHSNNILITGGTSSALYPTTSGTFQTSLAGAIDIVVTRLHSDNTLAWSTFYGGNGDDQGHGIAIDSKGNVIVAGHTTSSNLPVTMAGALGGQRDVVVVKFDSTGKRIWGRYYGGNQLDDGYSLVLDSAGNPAVFLTTATFSGLLITTGQTTFGGGTYDVLLVKFDNVNAAVSWSTYLGGPGNDFAFSATPDKNNNIVIAGWTTSSAFPVLNPAQSLYSGGDCDAFIAKYSSDGNKLWATYCGGSGSEVIEPVVSLVGDCGIATDDSNNICFVGYTTSTNFPVKNAYQSQHSGGSGTSARDAFIVKYNPDGSLLWSTYFGSANTQDYASAVTFDKEGSVWVTGLSAGVPGPTTPDAFQSSNAGSSDMFLIRLNSDGTVLQYSTMYGGTASDEGSAIAIDRDNAVVVLGETSSANFPVIGPASSQPLQSQIGGVTDLFVLKFCQTSEVNVEASLRTTHAHIFPQPVANEMIIRWNTVPKHAPVEFRVRDITGRQVGAGIVPQGSDHVIWQCPENTTSGVYSLMLFDATGVVVASSLFVKY